MIDRLLNILKSNSFFLFGPRGSGKTTYLKQLIEPDKSLWIDLLNPKTEDKYLLKPETLLEEAALLKTEWIVIDEIQKIPKLLDVVHQLIETTKIKFALTGSSARKLKRGAANLLAGRAFVYNLYPFSSRELGTDFKLDNALTWGTLPKIFQLSKTEEKELFLESYCHTYLKEEVIAEQLIRNVRPFRQFIEVAAQNNCEILNYSKLSRQIGVDDKTIASYYDILVDTLVGIFLPSYNQSLRKQFIKSPKFYLFDCGVSRALSNRLHLPVEKSTFQYGKLFEQFIILEIHKLNAYLNKKFKMYYFQSKDGVEIDLILERPGTKRKFIEIKSSDSPDKEDLRSLTTFAKEFNNSEYFCLCQTQTPSLVDKVKVLPWTDGINEVLEI